MPLGEIAEEALGALVRLFGRILVEVVFEIIVRGTGYVLLRFFRPRVEPGETSCAVVGLLFWVGLSMGGLFLYRHLTAA